MKPLINLTEEISLRSRLSGAFDAFLSSFTGEKNPLRAHPGTSSFTEELALLLAETIELRKKAEKEEKFLKSLILESGQRVFDYPSLVITVEDRTRRDLDKVKLLAYFGADVIDPFLKETQFKLVSVIRKAL